MRLYTAFSCLQLQFTRQDLPACDDINFSLIIYPTIFPSYFISYSPSLAHFKTSVSFIYIFG